MRKFFIFFEKNNDEFTIIYRGMEICELEEDVLQIIIEHYENKLVSLNKKLEKL